MLGYYIGTIPVSVPTCADDMACIATTRTGLQTMINVASRDANNEHYTFGYTLPTADWHLPNGQN